MLLLFLIAPLLASAQLPNGVVWDVAVGCQESTLEYGFNVEGQENCIKVCEGSTVNYTLYGGDPQQWVDVQWLVTGGNLNTSTNTTASIDWGDQGWGSILLIIETQDGIFEQEICIEIIASPLVNFTVYPEGPKVETIEVCQYETLYFENLSVSDGGSPLVSHQWDFGDGATSTEFEPEHAFQDPGKYTVVLTVTNACGCSAYRKITVIVKEPGLQIVCNSIACENGLESYTVELYQTPGEPLECKGYDWQAQGGQIISQNGPSVDAQWDNVDNDGFGYLTFTPDSCTDVECTSPVTIKVPVIIDDVEIDGPDKICADEQFRYAIPQWPSTEVEWKVTPPGGTLYPSDQSNEIILEANVPGNYVLEAIYTNTLKGCGGSSLKEIEVVPVVDIQGPVELCEGDPGIFTNSGGLYVNWVLEGPSGTQTASGTTFTHTFSDPGLYSLSLGQGGQCLLEVHHIQVSPKPAAPVGINGPLEVCLGVPITYSVAPPPGSAIAVWTVGNGVFAETLSLEAIGNEVSVVWDPTPNPPYSYDLRVVYVQNGCASDAVQVIPVPLNVNFAISGPQAVCSSSYETYSVDYLEGDKYEWSINPPNLGSVGEYPQDDQVDILWNNVSSPVQAVIEVKIKKCGNTHTKTYPVTVQNTPQISISAPTSVCRDEPVNFGITGLTSWSSITWEFGDGATAINNDNPVHTYTDLNQNNTSYTVTVTVEGPNGCTNNATASFNIQVQPAPVAWLTPATNHSYCDLAELNANPPTFTLTLDSNYGAATSIDWFHNGSQISLPPMTYSYTAGQFGDYYAVVTSANGCSDTTNAIHVGQRTCTPGGGGGCLVTEEVSSVSAQMTGCTTATATVVYTGSPIGYQWYLDSDPLTGQNMNSANFTVSGVGVHIVSYTAIYNGTDTNGDPCTYAIANFFELIVPYEPILYYDITCASSGGYDVTLYDASDYFPTTPINYFDFRVDGVSYGNGGANGQVTVPSLSPGPHTLKLEIDGASGHPCTATLTITLPALPTAQINAPQQACAGDPVQFTATVNNPNVQYEWNFDDQALNSLPNPIRVFDNSKPSYKVSLTVTNQYGCSVTIQKTIGVESNNFVGTLSLNPTTTCYGNPITIVYNPSQGTISNYIWHQEVDGTVVNTFQTSVPNLTVTEPGLYILDGVGAPPLSCIEENISRIKVTFLETPEARITGPNEVCADGSFQLNASPVHENDYQYVWKRDGQVLSQFNNEPVIDQQLPTPGTYNYEVTVSTSAGCNDTTSFSVQVFPNPAPPSVSMQVTGCNPYTVELTAQANEPGTFVWSDGQSGANIEVHYGGPYRATFFNQYGCASSVEIDVPFDPSAYIWVHPEGCYEVCETTMSDYYLSGPSIPFQYWEWQIDGNLENSGSGTVAGQYWNGDGFYQLILDNGVCSVTSEGMSWQLSPGGCEGWCEITVQVQNIDPSMDMYGNCYYLIDVLFINNDPPFSYTLDNLSNGGVLVPGGGVLPTGATPAQLEFYPPAGFAGGNVNFRVLLELLQGEGPDCAIEFIVNFPPCPPGSSRPGKSDALAPGQQAFENSFAAMPNPTRGILNIGYNLQSPKNGTYSLHLYDLTGREIRSEQLKAPTGKQSFDLNGQANGTYLLLLRKNGKPLGYKKIILNK